MRLAFRICMKYSKLKCFQLGTSKYNIRGQQKVNVAVKLSQEWIVENTRYNLFRMRIQLWQILINEYILSLNHYGLEHLKVREVLFWFQWLSITLEIMLPGLTPVLGHGNTISRVIESHWNQNSTSLTSNRIWPARLT